MTTQCPSCGDHYTTHEPGHTAAGYTTPLVDVDIPGELEVVGTHMETKVAWTSTDAIVAVTEAAAHNGWAVRQIIYTVDGASLVVYERPYGWADDE